MKNQTIKKLAKENNVFLWQIAEELGITDATFSRKLRKEFSDEEQTEISRIIQDIAQKEA